MISFAAKLLRLLRLLRFLRFPTGANNASEISESVLAPLRGNAVKLRICVNRHDSASGDRLLKFLRVLRLLRFSECANRR